MSLYRVHDLAQYDHFLLVEACYAWTWNAFHMSPHCHDRAEIMYMLHGQCRIVIFDGNEPRERQMGVGEFVYICPGVMHALHVDESGYMVNVEFSLRGQSRLMTYGGLVNQSPVLRQWENRHVSYQYGKDVDGAFYNVLSLVIDDYVKGDQMDQALKALHLAQMMILMATFLTSAESNINRMIHVRKCVQLLSERLDTDIRIDEIARDIGVSTAYLQRLFHQVQGETIIEYLNRHRIERAKLLLMNTKASVVEIAFASGFNSRQHFTRVFTSLEGCSPKQFRSVQKAVQSKEVFLF